MLSDWYVAVRVQGYSLFSSSLQVLHLNFLSDTV
jgi:hypothetical protein